MKRIAGWLRALADWLDPPVSVNPYLAAARALVARADELVASGEHKRHVVYAALLKQFPDARHRDLALAIELVKQETP